MTPGNVTTGTGDTLYFGTDTATYGLGAGTVGVSGTVNAGSLYFGSQSGAITLSSGATINGTTGLFDCSTPGKVMLDVSGISARHLGRRHGRRLHQHLEHRRGQYRLERRQLLH